MKFRFIQTIPTVHQNNVQQELRSWFKANAIFPSTTPAAHMNNSAGWLSQPHHDLSYSMV